MAEGDVVSLYRNDGWVDLCEGHVHPRVASARPADLAAGAYWRGSETSPMLTRIYGTAWATEGDLEEHLRKLEGRNATTASSDAGSTSSRVRRLGPGLSGSGIRGAACSWQLKDGP